MSQANEKGKKMCDFPSWIEREGQVLFLTGKGDLPEGEKLEDLGHVMLHRVYGTEPGDKDGEGFPCPPEIAVEIQRGNMRAYMLASCQYAEVHVSADGQLHREDGPAVTWANGMQEWWWAGQRHREDGPAITWPDGQQAWYWAGERHREDGPAITLPDGRQEWYWAGDLHREDGPAIIYADGTQVWYWAGERYLPAE